METKEFACSPLLATLISHFEDKKQWTAEELSNETGVPIQIIQKRMLYWVNQRVVKVVHTTSNSGGGTIYHIAHPQHLASAATSRASVDASSLLDELMHEDDEARAVSVTTGPDEEELDVYVSYIVGMLTRLGQLSLQTIHNNLKTHVTGSDLQYNQTPAQLATLLQQLCRQERLECGPDGMYKLFKK
jgi:anaphase-promoting complex subunit 2